ncbi:ThuA domain-containing protein [Limihaloglobus sulfuriphilus]
MINVTVWNEFRHERHSSAVRSVYPEGIHQAIAAYLASHPDMLLKAVTLSDPEQGLGEKVLNDTDVLLWWGHTAHDEVDDELVERVCSRVLAGMGLIVLHSAHFSKVFRKLMGTTCSLRWREEGERSRLWTVNPSHPICRGVPEQIVIENDEMYGEFFDIPAPDELVFVSWYQGGEVFRSGCTWQRGKGRIFYFAPGHETYPIYHTPEILKIIENAVRWARPESIGDVPDCIKQPPFEKI